MFVSREIDDDKFFRHTKGPGKCVWLYGISEYLGFILVNRNTLRPLSENSGVGLHKFHCSNTW
jgi:hypothetical protein